MLYQDHDNLDLVEPTLPGQPTKDAYLQDGAGGALWQAAVASFLPFPALLFGRLNISASIFLPTFWPHIKTDAFDWLMARGKVLPVASSAQEQNIHDTMIVIFYATQSRKEWGLLLLYSIFLSSLSLVLCRNAVHQNIPSFTREITRDEHWKKMQTYVVRSINIQHFQFIF